MDAAYHAFMHAPEWWLTGRSDDAAKAAAQWGDEEVLRLRDELDQLDHESPDVGQPEHTAHLRTTDETRSMADEQEVQSSFLEDAPEPPSGEYQQHRAERPAEEPKGGGCLRGCLIWVISLVGIGVVALLVLFSLDVVSPRDKPCPLESPPIPTPAQIAVAGDLFRDACVSIRGTVVSLGIDELVMEVDRGEYLQRVNVHDPSQALEAITQSRVVILAGWLRIEEDGTYDVHFVPDRGSDREWWRNLLDNLEALF